MEHTRLPMCPVGQKIGPGLAGGGATRSRTPPWDSSVHHHPAGGATHVPYLSDHDILGNARPLTAPGFPRPVSIPQHAAQPWLFDRIARPASNAAVNAVRKVSAIFSGNSGPMGSFGAVSHNNRQTPQPQTTVASRAATQERTRRGHRSRCSTPPKSPPSARIIMMGRMVFMPSLSGPNSCHREGTTL